MNPEPFNPLCRVRDFFNRPWTVGALVRFHTMHKLLIMAHSPEAYVQLGWLVANSWALPPGEVARAYTSAFAAALGSPPSRGRHVNVLQHIAGHLSDLLAPDSKAELTAAIDGYRRGVLPLHIPVAMLGDHARVHQVGYLSKQVYLETSPPGV
jgi:uncharacterized protein YbgA (DUF1722 family)